MMSQSLVVRNSWHIVWVMVVVSMGLWTCNSDDDAVDSSGMFPGGGGGSGDAFVDDGKDPASEASLHKAFQEFNTEHTNIYLEGTQVVVETNGLPDHKTVYYGSGNALYQVATVATALTPSTIPNYEASAVLRVAQQPVKASSTTATSLGAIGIAISGAAIFNDQEGNGALDQAVGSLDYSGGHIGPAEYHYHLEPKAWSDDDDDLIGILADGFFVYGRKCNSTGTYPTDLDASGGHSSTTQHTSKAEYHYHIINSLYSTTGRYILFAGPYQGTPNAIN